MKAGEVVFFFCLFNFIFICNIIFILLSHIVEVNTPKFSTHAPTPVSTVLNDNLLITEDKAAAEIAKSFTQVKKISNNSV